MTPSPRLLVVLSALLLPACDLAAFDVDQPIREQQVQGSGIPTPLAALFPLPLSLDLEAAIRQHDTGPIDRIALTSLTLDVTATARPAGDVDDWAFVDSVEVFVRSTRDGSTLPRVRIAHAAAPGAVTTLRFAIDDGVDLQPYVDQGAAVETSASGTQPTDDVSFVGAAVFTVYPL